MSRGGARHVWAAGVGLAALMGAPAAHANMCDCSRIVAQCNAVFNVDSKPQSTTFAGDGASAQSSYQTTIHARFRPNASGTMHGAYVGSPCLNYEIVYGNGRVLMAGTLTNGARHVKRNVFTADELDAASLRTSTCGICFDEDTERLKDQIDEDLAAQRAEAEAAARRQELEDYYLTEDVSHLSTEELEALQRNYPTLRADEAKRLRDEQRGAGDADSSGSGSCWDGPAIDGPCPDDDGAEIDPFPEVGEGDWPQLTDPDEGDSGGDGSGWTPGDGAGGPGRNGDHDPYADLDPDPYSGTHAGRPAFAGEDPSEPSPYDDDTLSAFMRKAAGGADLQALSNDVRARLDDYEDDDYARQADAAGRLSSAQEWASSRAESRIERIEQSAAMARPDLLGGYSSAGGYPSAGYPSGAPSSGGGPVNEAAEQAKCRRAAAPYLSGVTSQSEDSVRGAMIAQLRNLEIASRSNLACLNVMDPRSNAYRTIQASQADVRAKIAQLKRSIDQVSVNDRPRTAPTRSSSGCGPGITGVAC